MLAALALALWTAGTPHFVFWGRPDAPAMARLDARQAEVSRAMAWYAYGYHHWTVHELRSPLIHDHFIFKLLATDAAQSVSELVVILPRAGAGAARLVPIRYGGVVHAGTDVDLHNVAIFNAVMSAEPQFHPAGAADWIELGELYLNLVGELPQIVNAARLRAAPRAALPQVTPTVGGGAQVEFTDYEGPSALARWRFVFDAGGRLRGLHLQM